MSEYKRINHIQYPFGFCKYNQNTFDAKKKKKQLFFARATYANIISIIILKLRENISGG